RKAQLPDDECVAPGIGMKEGVDDRGQRYGPGADGDADEDEQAEEDSQHDEAGDPALHPRAQRAVLFRDTGGQYLRRSGCGGWHKSPLFNLTVDIKNNTPMAEPASQANVGRLAAR